MTSPRYLVFTEQVVLSGLTFFSLLVFARYLDKFDWGVFSISIALFHFLQGFQRALVTIPLITYSPGEDKTKSSYVFWLRTMHRVVGAGVAIALLVLLASAVFFPEHWLSSACLILLIIFIPHFYYEFARRCLIQLGMFKQLLALSLLAAVVTGTAVIFSMLLSRSAIISAVAYSSGAAVVSVIALLALKRVALLGSQQIALTNQKELRDFSRWSLYSHFAFSAYVIAIPVVLGFLSTPAAVAVLTAVRNLVQPLNTLLSAVDNVDKPRASAAWADGGIPDLLNSLSQTRKVLGYIGGAYLVLILIFGEPILSFLYAGKYDGNYQMLIVWALVYVFMIISQPTETGLYVLRKPAHLFKARTIAAGVGMLVALVSIPRLGALGAGCGLLAGWACNALITRYLLLKASQEADLP